MWTIVVSVVLSGLAGSGSARNNGYFRAFRDGYYPGKEAVNDFSAAARSHFGYSNRQTSGRLMNRKTFGYRSYPVYMLEPDSSRRHFSYPVYPFHRYGEPDESIYEYRMAMKLPTRRPNRIKKMERVRSLKERVHKVDNERIKQRRKMMEPMKKKQEKQMKEESRRMEKKVIMTKQATKKQENSEYPRLANRLRTRKRKPMGRETVHSPRYVAMDRPQLVRNKAAVPRQQAMVPRKPTAVPGPAVRSSVNRVHEARYAQTSHDTRRKENAGLVFFGKYPGMAVKILSQFPKFVLALDKAISSTSPFHIAFRNIVSHFPVNDIEKQLVGRCVFKSQTNCPHQVVIHSKQNRPQASHCRLGKHGASIKCNDVQMVPIAQNGHSLAECRIRVASWSTLSRCILPQADSPELWQKRWTASTMFVLLQCSLYNIWPMMEHLGADFRDVQRPRSTNQSLLTVHGI